MKETIARYRDMLAARLGLLMEEIRLTEARYKEREGDFHYVTLENLALFERNLHEIEKLRDGFQAMDIEEFDSIEEFREHVLAQLQKTYEARALIRPSLRMVMECVKTME